MAILLCVVRKDGMDQLMSVLFFALDSLIMAKEIRDDTMYNQTNVAHLILMGRLNYLDLNPESIKR